MKMKFDSKKAVKIGSFAIGVASLLISNLVSKNERAEMKGELRDEILKELSKGKD